MSLASATGRTAVVLTMAAAVLVACSGDPAPACAAVALPPGPGSNNSSKSSTSSSTSTGTSQTQPQRQTTVNPPQNQTKPVQPQGQVKPATPQTGQPQKPLPTSTSIPKYQPATPKAATPYRRSAARSYPTQQSPIWHGSYRQYPNYPGWYLPYVYPIGYAEQYGCTMTGTEGAPAADVNGDGIPDEATDW